VKKSPYREIFKVTSIKKNEPHLARRKTGVMYNANVYIISTKDGEESP